ncbi:MAG: carboxylating nicotinate-nucleotide diphosphorylase [Chloroflexi bacterium]|nr:carboxylating nicotinate-nucleotide diphosphorylase [Chloroflexota bacterium]
METRDLIQRALAEDQAIADVTTAALVPPSVQGSATIKSKAEGVLAGIEVCLEVFRCVDPNLSCHALLADGATIHPGDSLATVRGRLDGILRAERTALNFLQRLSGIATETARYVMAVHGLRARIVDTRKTLPGFRHLDKYAVRMGGGHNHRLNLADGILVKDNHLAALAAAGLSLRQAVERAIQNAPHTLKVEVEVESLDQVQEALEAGAHILLLDNMGLAEMRQAAEMCRGRAITEASGGVRLETVRAVAETGVDLISVGALTHSVRALDISLDLEG